MRAMPPPRPAVRLALALVASAALLLPGCGGDRPQGPVMGRAEAEHDQRAMRLKVLKTYDNAASDFSQDPYVWYVVDVEVLDGPPDLIGKTLSLPYDDRIVGTPVPTVGTVVVCTPADWVRRSSKGKVGVFGQ